MTQRSAASTSTHRVPHRVTVRKTAYQVQRLQEMWAQTHTPTKEQREQIADEIGLDTRIVSTWFRDERSKITRANAERQRVERATLGPVRNTRTGIATRFKNELEIEEDEEEDEKAPFDRHNPKQLLTRPSPRPRYAPYDVPHSSFNVDHVKKPSQRHFDPLIRASVPIDLIQPAHPSQLSISMDNESYGYPSPAAYPRQSLPAPSISSSETSEDEDDLDEDHEGALTRTQRPRDFSPRTPGLVPSTIPSPRVVVQSTASPTALPPISTFVTNPELQASSPRPHSDVFLAAAASKSYPAKSPFAAAPITLPTQSGGTYTFNPPPVIIGQLPKRDSKWRFGYYDKVSSLRHTLGDRIHHGEVDARMEDSDDSDEDSGTEHALSATTSPTFRATEVQTGSFGGWFGGKKQLFVDPARHAD